MKNIAVEDPSRNPSLGGWRVDAFENPCGVRTSDNTAGRTGEHAVPEGATSHGGNDDALEPEGGSADSFSVESPIDQLAEIVAACMRELPDADVGPHTWMSFGVLEIDEMYPVRVPIRQVAALLNAVGAAMKDAGMVDAQFSVSRRWSKGAKEMAELWGVVVDVDLTTEDILATVERAGLPLPAFYFPTPHGFKIGYAFAEKTDAATLKELGQRLTLALEGGDPSSWEPHQQQRLPTCLRRMDDGNVVEVHAVAMLANPVALRAEATAVPFPFRVRKALGEGSLSHCDKQAIRNYLDELGIPAPEEPGSILYDRCPVAIQHDSRCCYVNMSDGGEIFVCCLGGHGGEGHKTWRERGLAELAGINGEDNGVAGFLPLRDLPVTPGAQRFIRHMLRDWPEPSRAAAESLWRMDWARREARGEVSPCEVLRVYEQRLEGLQGLPSMAMYFDIGSGCLMHDEPSGRRLPVTSRNGPSLTANAHEFTSTALWAPKLVLEEVQWVLRPGWLDLAPSLLNKAAVGYQPVLAKLGIAAVVVYELPVAHVEETWEIAADTLHVKGVLTCSKLDDVEEIDALEYFLELYRTGQLPFASEDDALLFVVLVASPLLRDVAPGHLGVYWFVGPPGSGKDLLAELARKIWEACAAHLVRVSFDLNLAGDQERKRSLEMAAGCVFARAKEAGKRPGMAGELIQLAGTDSISVRGLWKNEVNIPNTFTYVADSAEDMPDRREISRRALPIHVAHMDESIPKGEVLAKICAVAPGLIKWLKRLVETKPRDWYLMQSDTGSRPLIPVALARLLGANLPPVEGADLTEVFEAMAEFVKSDEGLEEGRNQVAKAVRRGNKETVESRTMPSFRFSYFVDTVGQQPGNKELFSPFLRKSKELINRIMRESDYRTATAHARYMKVRIGDKDWAFRIESGRRFLLVEEVEFRKRMRDAKTSASTQQESAPVTPICESSPDPASDGPGPGASDGEPTFRADSAALLKKVGAP